MSIPECEKTIFKKLHCFVPYGLVIQAFMAFEALRLRVLASCYLHMENVSKMTTNKRNLNISVK
jgi:hypothetical protein